MVSLATLSYKIYIYTDADVRSKNLEKTWSSKHMGNIEHSKSITVEVRRH